MCVCMYACAYVCMYVCMYEPANTRHWITFATSRLYLQNLRDALDNIYDAKVPKIWGKVSYYYYCYCCYCYYYTDFMGLLNYWVLVH